MVSCDGCVALADTMIHNSESLYKTLYKTTTSSQNRQENIQCRSLQKKNIMQHVGGKELYTHINFYLKVKKQCPLWQRVSEDSDFHYNSVGTVLSSWAEPQHYRDFFPRSHHKLTETVYQPLASLKASQHCLYSGTFSDGGVAPSFILVCKRGACFKSLISFMLKKKKRRIAT